MADVTTGKLTIENGTHKVVITLDSNGFLRFKDENGNDVKALNIDHSHSDPA